MFKWFTKLFKDNNPNKSRKSQNWKKLIESYPTNLNISPKNL